MNPCRRYKMQCGRRMLGFVLAEITLRIEIILVSVIFTLIRVKLTLECVTTTLGV
jgi:hypothetical protein